MRSSHVIAVAAVVACAPANPTPEVVRPVALVVDAGPVGPGFVTPSKWALSYSPRWRAVATLDLDSGSKLHAGDGGERWVENVAGTNDGASTLAPERIVGIQKMDDHAVGGFRFVGASGTVYVARDALGTLSRSGNPVEGARQVAVGKSAILVVDGKGDLQRSTDGGRAWARVDLPQKEGIVVDVAMLGDKGILVGAPQRFFGTKDDGITWTPVKSPGVGVQTVVARDGALMLDGVEDSLRFDAAWNTFQPATSARSIHRPYVPPVQTTVTNRVDGRRMVQVKGSGTERVWTVAVGDMSGLGKPHKLDDLDGCEMVDVAMRGDDIALACDARGSLATGIDKDATAPIQKYGYGKSSGPPDGGTLGWITRIVRSTDGGRTFREETTVEGGITQRSDVSIAIGSEDFIYLGRRCAAGYNAACLPARVRATRSAGFSDVAEDDNTNNGHMHFATNGMQSAVYSLGVRDGEAFLFRWKSGSAVPEPVGRIAPNIDQVSATLSLDDDGTVRGFARTGANPFTFTYKEGGTVITTNVQVPLVRAAFAGIHGFGVTNVNSPGDAKAYETVDGGKTWGLVGAPAYVNAIESCSTFGCVTDRGVRWGWDAPAGTPDGTTAQAAATSKPAYARPLRCSAKDKWVDLGGGNLPTVSYVDHGALRWVLPVRDKDGKVALLTSKRGDAAKTSSISLFGAPPNATKFGSATTMHVQPDGVVALRYSYSRDRKGSGRYNPVDAQLAWFRDGTGKVFHAAVSKTPAFRVNKDPQGGYDRDSQPTYSELPEVVSLAPKGVYFHSGAYAEEDETGNNPPKRIPLVLLRDDGKTEKASLPPEGTEISGAGVVVSLDGTTSLMARSPESWQSLTLSDGKKTVYSVLGGLGDDDGVVDLVTLGGKSAFAATLRDPARAWIISLKPEPDLGPITSIATQKSLGDTPKPCDGAATTDPNAYRVDAPYVFGSRRPVVVDSDGVAIILATDRAELRGTLGQPDACVAAFDAMTPAQDGDHDYGALVFTDDLGHSLLFRADTSSWPGIIAVRPMECQYQAGPLPDELESVEGFVADTRHAAVPHKRY